MRWGECGSWTRSLHLRGPGVCVHVLKEKIFQAAADRIHRLDTRIVLAEQIERCIEFFMRQYRLSHLAGAADLRAQAFKLRPRDIAVPQYLHVLFRLMQQFANYTDTAQLSFV